MLRTPLALLLALCTTHFGAIAAAGAQEGAAAVATERCGERAAAAVQKRYEGVKSLAARFEQTTNAARIGPTPSEPVVSRGHVVLEKPGKMRWTYEEPEPSVVVSDGKTLWLYDPTFHEAQKLPAGGGFLTGAAAEFLLGAGDIRRDFAIRAVSCSTSAAELELVPREPASFEKVFLELDPEAGDVRGTRIVDLLGNVVSVRFDELRFNLAPRAEEFRFDPPEGVKVIELSP